MNIKLAADARANDDAHRPEDRIAHIVRQAARRFNRSLQIRLGAYDISFGLWIFLRILWDTDGLTQRELSERANLTEPTTHTALRRLEALGYVTRRNLPGNRRRQHTFLTPAGRALRDTLEPLALEVNAIATQGLSEQQQNDLRAMLGAIIENLRLDEAEELTQGRRVPPTRVRLDE